MVDINIGSPTLQPFSQEDWTTRRSAVRRELLKAGATAVISGPGDDMRYLLGGHSIADERPCLLFTTVTDDGLLLPRLAEEELRALTAGMRVQVWEDGDSVLAALRELMDNLGLPSDANLIIDPTVRADVLLLIQAARPASKTGVYPQLVAAARATKYDKELSRLRDAARLADSAVEYAWSMVQEGISERELSSLVRSFHENNGGEAAFAGVSFGRSSALPHHTPGDRRLERGDAILLDTGSRLGGYTSDITRMAWFGSSPSEEFRQLMEQVEQAVQAGYAAALPGVSGGAVDAASRESLTKVGLGAHFIHRTGHGIGLSIHEPPYLAPGSEDVLLPRSTFTIEPGAYLTGRFGVRLEDSVVMTENGAEPLTALSRELTVIVP